METQAKLGTDIITETQIIANFEDSKFKAQAFLYDDMQKISDVFTQGEIELIFYTLQSSNNYLKTIWGSWMKARDLCILAALRYMLLRPKEACSLAFHDFIWSKNLVKIRGENNKEKKDRFVSIHPTFVKFYQEYMSFPKWMWKDSPYLFPSAENKYLSTGTWKRIFREKALKAAGLYYEGRRSYTLRATGATELLDEGADPWTVAQTLGHGDTRTIKSYYFQTERFRRTQAHWMNKLK